MFSETAIIRKTAMRNTGTDAAKMEMSVSTVLVVRSMVSAAVEPQDIPMISEIMSDEKRSPAVEGRVSRIRSITGRPEMSEVPRLRQRRLRMYFPYSGSSCPWRSMS